MSDNADGNSINPVDQTEGSVVTRKVQKKGRVNLPEKYLNYLGVDEGENIMMVAEDDEVKVVPASIDRIASEAFLLGVFRATTSDNDGY